MILGKVAAILEEVTAVISNCVSSDCSLDVLIGKKWFVIAA